MKYKDTDKNSIYRAYYNKEGITFIVDLRTKSYVYNCTYSNFTFNPTVFPYDFTLASYEECEHLIACMKAGKYVPKPKTVDYEIY